MSLVSDKSASTTLISTQPAPEPIIPKQPVPTTLIPNPTNTTPPKEFVEYISNAGLTLLPHQIEGVNWCLSKEKDGFAHRPIQPHIRCGLIADEMGLGKTIQIIGTMLCNPKQRTLLVMPKALLSQWYKIIKTTTDLSVYIYHGPKREESIKVLKSYQVIITTYGLIATHSTNINNPKDPANRPPTTLHAISWSRIVFDEAHHMRNKTTAIHNGAKKLSAITRWLVTGTPIQNSIEDFHNLASVMGLKPGFYMDPEHTNTFIQNLLLKRTKSEVNLLLPKLVVHEIEVPWQNESEKRLAQEIHARLKFSNVCTPKNAKTTHRLPKSALPLLTRSRQLCVLPALTKKKLKQLKNIPTPDSTAESSEIPSDAETERFIDEATGHTSKLNAVIKQIIANKTNDTEKLIFCHYHDEIDFIKLILEKAGFETHSFDGRTSLEDREKILSSTTTTTTKPKILVLQINTGCEGLNLQQYSEIYFVSPHWNPAIEDQAIARAYRIGQEKETHVYRFNMAPFDVEKKTLTLDEHANNIQETKRETMKILDKT